MFHSQVVLIVFMNICCTIHYSFYVIIQVIKSGFSGFYLKPSYFMNSISLPITRNEALNPFKTILLPLEVNQTN